MAALDPWLILQALALVTAGFGVWILSRACWEYAGVPAVHDAYLQLVDTRLQELEVARAAAAQGSGAPAAEASGGSLKTLLASAEPTGPRRRSPGFNRRIREALASRPSARERAASQSALLRMLGRPQLVLDQQELAADALGPVAGAVAVASDERELAAAGRLRRAVVLDLLRREVPARFRAVFLPGMARYLDFVGRGSSLGLAVGVLLAGGLSGNTDLVGALTTVCGVGGAIVFTLTVIRCEARSWPAGRAGLWLRLARRFPQLFFLLRLVLTTAALLLGLYILGR